MRSLFYLLVLANLAFAAWAAWFAAPDAPSSARPPDTRPLDAAPPSRQDSAEGPTATPPAERVETPGTVEVEPTESAGAPGTGRDTPADTAEPPGAGRDTPADTAESPGAGSNTAADTAEPLHLALADGGEQACTMVGPFSDRDTAEAAADGLAADQARIREADGDVWLDYWVNLSSLATREQTAAAIETLRAGGFDDAYVIRGDEEGGDIISLGVFREMSRADRLSGQIRALGLTPSIVDRFRSGTVYWLVIEPAAGNAASELDLERGLETLRDLPDGPRLEQRPCTPAD